MIRLGLQIPNFTYPGVTDAELFENVAALATAAETAGFDSVWVMDHFYQLPGLGPPTNNMLESYTLLAALAARTDHARLGTLVTGVTYRNPAILAKQVTTLDVISRGRAILGIGAAWYETEHEGLGVDFPPVGERMDRLEEALVICRAMFRDERPSFAGRYYRIQEAINRPAPVQPGGPPILIGGQGEKRTLKLVARYADAVNLIAARDDLPRKVAVLGEHCADAGRDPATISTSWLASAVVGASTDEARRLWDGQGGGRPRDRALVGTPDDIAAEARDVMDAVGLDGIILNFPLNGADTDAVAAVGAALAPAS